jgi:hypothetical protein
MGVDGDARLESIYVHDVMVPAGKLVTAVVPAEEGASLTTGILPRLKERGLGRLIVVKGSRKSGLHSAPERNGQRRGAR